MAPSEARAGPPAPVRLGPYRLLGPIAQGGSGVIHRAVHVDSGDTVALKTLRAVEPSDVERLRRETHALGALRHPGVVRVVAQGVDGGLPWYAMELIEGRTLDQVWGETPLEETLRLLRRLCGTLAFLHGEGIVHRDLTPANVIVRRGGVPVLVDFGFVSRFGGPLGREALEAGGEVLGTLAYMAPEQARGEYVDARADLYALGCILYEAITGRPPFVGTPWEVMTHHLETEPVPPSQRTAGVPLQLDWLVLRLLAKQPRHRIGYAVDVAAVLAELAPGGDAVAPDAPRSYLYRPTFAGRKDALSQIALALRRVSAGAGECVLVAGVSGAGKTRLAMEATREATHRGFRVITGECVALESTTGAAEVRGSPLHPLRPLLRAIADSCRVGGVATTERLLGRRGKVLVEYEQHLAGLPGQSKHPDPVPLAAAASRARLLTDLTDTLTAFASEQPLLLVIDDLQWADDLTLALLGALGPAFYERSKLLVLGTFRTEETSDALLAVTHGPSVARIDLERLGVGSIGSIVADMLAIEPPPAPLVRFLARESDGNPFFVSEYLRTAVDAQLLRRTPTSGWTSTAAGSDTDADFSALALPNSLRDLIGRRLEGLPRAARALLEAAAVLGREFVVDLAGAVGHLDDAERFDAVSVLLRRHVLEDVDGERFRFVHDKLREAAAEQTPPDAARALHGRAAAALESRHRDDLDFAQHYAALAHHWSMAGIDDKALEYLGRAGEHALRTGAHADARSLLTRALALDDRVGRRVPPLVRGTWQRMLGEASFALGDIPASRERSAQALADLGHPVPRAASGWIATLALEVARQMMHRYVPSRALAVRDPRRAALAEEVQALNQLSQATYFTAETVPCLTTLVRATNQAERADVGWARTRAYARLAYVAGQAGLRGIARRYFTRTYAQGRVAADDWGLALGLYLDAGFSVGLCQWDYSQRVGEEAVRLLEQSGDHQEAEVARTIVACALFYGGRFEEAITLARVTLDTARERANPQHVAWGPMLIGRSLVALGRPSEAVGFLEEARGLLLPLEADRFSIVMCEGPLAKALLGAGRLEAASEVTAALARRLLERKPSPYPPCVDGYGGLAEAQLALWACARDAATRALREKAARHACADLRRFARVFSLGVPVALRCAAHELWLRGRARAARRMWERAVDAARVRSMPYEQALAHAALAVCAASPEDRRGHDDAARALFASLRCAGQPEDHLLGLSPQTTA